MMTNLTAPIVHIVVHSAKKSFLMNTSVEPIIFDPYHGCHGANTVLFIRSMLANGNTIRMQNKWSTSRLALSRYHCIHHRNVFWRRPRGHSYLMIHITAVKVQKPFYLSGQCYQIKTPVEYKIKDRHHFDIIQISLYTSPKYFSGKTPHKLLIDGWCHRTYCSDLVGFVRAIFLI